jgi:hypothetical protein
MTIWPAYQHFEETTKGSLEPGKLADFVILSMDPTAIKTDTIADIKVTETIKEGKTIFTLKASGTAQAPADIMPLLSAFAGASGHNHGPGDCPSDAILALTQAMVAEGGKP